MIQPKCDHCGEELDAEGGVVVSPPNISPLGKTSQLQTTWRKLHICLKCWPHFEEWMMCPQGNISNLISVCQDLLKLNGYISMHESFEKDWEPIVEKARQAITYKGGGTIRP